MDLRGKAILFLSISLSFSASAKEYISISNGSTKLRSNYWLDSSWFNDKYGSPTSRLDYDIDSMKTTEIVYGTDEESIRLLATENILGTIEDYDWYQKEYAISHNSPILWQDTTSSVTNGYYFDIEYKKIKNSLDNLTIYQTYRTDKTAL